jgi:spore coat protein U-like protein
MIGRRSFAALAAAFATLAGGSTQAAAESCNVSPLGVNFGTYDSLSPTPLEGVGNVAVECDAAVSFTISLSTGNGTYDDRRMTGPASELSYNLYSDASRLGVWGDGTGGSAIVSITASTADIPVYGRIPAHQNVPAATYADIIMVTITY